MSETDLRVNVTGTNDIAELDRKLKQFAATSKLTSRELVQQAAKTNSTKAVFRDYGQQVRDTQNKVVGYTDVLQNAQVVQNQFGQVASRSVRQMKRFGAVGMQQVGYQVGDFLVQIQSGTSAMVAFGQQGSQLAGIFGPGGAVVGALIAAGTALGMVFINARKAVEEDSTMVLSEFEKLGDGVDELKEKVVQFNKVSNLEFGGFLVGPENLGLLQQEINLRSELLAVEKARLQLKVEQARSEVETRRQIIEGLFEEARISYEIATQNATTDQERQSAMAAYQSATRTIIDQNKELFLTHRQQNAELELMENAIAQASNSTEEAVEKAQEFEENIQRAKETADSLGQSISSIDFSIPILGGNKLTAVLNQALGIANQIAGLLGAPSGGALVARAQDFVSGLYGRLEENAERILYERQIGGGRSMGMGGPTAEELRNTIPGQIAAQQNFIPEESGGGGGGGGSAPNETDLQILQKWIEDQEKRLSQEESLLGLSEQARRQREIEIELTNQLGELDGTVTQQQIENAAAVVAAREEAVEKMKQQEEAMQSFKDTVANELEGAFMSIIDGSKSAGEAFKDMVVAILKEAVRLLVIKPLINAIMGGLGGGGTTISVGKVPGLAFGGVLSRGNITPFADGGVVTGPKFFPMANGNVGLMGEAGPEAIMPLSRDKTGKLGVKVNGYQREDPKVKEEKEQNIVVTQNFEFFANGDESVKRIIAEEAPKIAEFTKKSLYDDRVRGKQAKRVFR